MILSGARTRAAAPVWGLATLLGVALAAAPLAAAPPPKPVGAEGRAREMQKLMDCRKVADNAQRLACFDEAAAAMDQAEAKGDIVVVDREQARKVRRQAFGFTLPSLSLFERGEKPEELETVQAKVVGVRQNGAGKWVLRLDSGAVWVQVDTNDIGTDPQAGETVTIRKAALGSYMLVLPHHRSFRAHREE
ncbi:MAG: hypothetical protein ACJ798_18750 [Phenylobacterium sp.]